MNKKAFTLVELIAVVVILGLIASITFVSISGQQRKVNEKERVALRSTIVGALQIYRTNNTVLEGIDNKVTLDKLKFTNRLNYNKVECDDLSNSYVYYVTKGSIDNDGSLEEVFCIQLSCNNIFVLNDVKDESNRYCYQVK